ncbi:MAG: ribosomal RNA small subunit methyltransferase A [Deltaproteobacteria bacterium]|nr:ribosomal RNA small subunit methyltransferase A [Deltaproteobacteria bacterium]
MAPRARWGQNFLVDSQAAERIVAWAGIDGAAVLEIGPGRGALTRLLAARASRLWLVEVDPELASHARISFVDDKRVTVFEGDALRLDLPALIDSGVHVVANLPYESGTAIVSSLLARRGFAADIVVMLQREVVARLAAKPGSKTYGSLSVLTQMTADVELGMVLAPRAFRPRPKVESQMVRLRPLAAPRFEVGDEALFREMVYQAFSMRRKMLRNSLGRWLITRFGAGGEAVCHRVFSAAAVAPTARPEELPGEAFAALSRAILIEDAKLLGAAQTSPGAAAAARASAAKENGRA